VRRLHNHLRQGLKKKAFALSLLLLLTSPNLWAEVTPSQEMVEYYHELISKKALFINDAYLDSDIQKMEGLILLANRSELKAARQFNPTYFRTTSSEETIIGNLIAYAKHGSDTARSYYHKLGEVLWEERTLLGHKPFILFQLLSKSKNRRDYERLVKKLL